MRRCLGILVFFTTGAIHAQDNAGITSKDVIGHLNQTITWYRRVAEVDQSSTAPENLLLQNNVHGTAKQVLKLAFDYARAQANLLSKTGPASPAQTLPQATANAQARADRIQSQLDNLDSQIAQAKASERPALVAKRKAMAANLALAKDVQASIKNMVSFASAPQGPGGGRALVDQINDLESLNSIVDAPDDTSRPPSKNDDAAPQAFHPENAGIITLISKATTLASDRSELDSLGRRQTACLPRLGNCVDHCERPYAMQWPKAILLLTLPTRSLPMIGTQGANKSTPWQHNSSNFLAF